MKLRDLVESVYVPPRKLTHYALDLTSDRGRDKAIVFASALGYHRDNYELLEAEIYRVALDAEVKIIREDMYGRHLQMDVEIVGAEGQREVVRFGWVIPPSSKQARLSTSYVRGT